jgi:uncharacterized membrane protein YccC
MPSPNTTLRLLADQTAGLIAGLAQVLDGLILLAGDEVRENRADRGFGLHVADWLPPLLNAGRTFAMIVAVQMVWIWTEWPNGAVAITFTLSP